MNTQQPMYIPAVCNDPSVETVCTILGIGRATLKRLQKSREDFPKPIHLTKTSVRFKRSEILDWMDGAGRNEHPSSAA